MPRARTVLGDAHPRMDFVPWAQDCLRVAAERPTRPTEIRWADPAAGDRDLFRTPSSPVGYPDRA